MELDGAGPDVRTLPFLGVEFAPIDLAGAAACVIEASRGLAFEYVVTPNVDHVVMLHQPPVEEWRVAYRAAVKGALLRLNDSRVLARLAALSGLSLPPVPGSDLTRTVIALSAQSTDRWMLVGGTQAELNWLRQAMPAATICQHQPPMGVRDDPGQWDVIAAAVEAADPAFVLLAFGAPQSEVVAARIRARGRARGVGLCIGASVEFLSGRQRRAPQWMQRAGLEWLHRLLSSPRRLWRRYLVEGPKIFAIWWRYQRYRLMCPAP